MPRDDGENVPQWRQRRRDAILRAATDLFGQHGYAGVQVDEVARAAGIGKPTLYRYFPSKEELFLETFRHALEALEAELDAIRRRDGPRREALAAMVGRLTDVLAEQTVSLRVLTGEHPELADRWRSLYRGRRRPILDALRAVILAGIESGEFRPVDVDVIPALLLGMVRGGLMGAPDVARRRLARGAIDLVLHGCQAGPADPILAFDKP